jgi:hypothetical protein
VDTGPAHAIDDLIVVVPGRRRVQRRHFSAGRIPFVGDADSSQWLTHRAASRSPRYIVTGHD